MPGKHRKNAPPKRRVPSPREELFVLEWLKNGHNASKAVEAAGYKSRGDNAQKHGTQILHRPHIQAMIAKHAEKASKRLEIEVDDVLREILILANSSEDDYEVGPDGRIRVKEGRPPEAIRAVSGYKINRYGEVEWKLWDKTKALDMLSRHLGLYLDKLQVRADINIRRADELTDEQLAAIVAKGSGDE